MGVDTRLKGTYPKDGYAAIAVVGACETNRYYRPRAVLRCLDLPCSEAVVRGNIRMQSGATPNRKGSMVTFFAVACGVIATAFFLIGAVALHSPHLLFGGVVIGLITALWGGMAKFGASKRQSVR